MERLIIDGSSGSRDVIYPIPGGGVLGERPVVPGGRESTDRKEQLQRQVVGDAAQGPVVKAKKDPSALSMGGMMVFLAKVRVKLIDGLNVT